MFHRIKFFSLINNTSGSTLCHNIAIFNLISIAGRNCPSTRHATVANLVEMCNDYIYLINKDSKTDVTTVAHLISGRVIQENKIVTDSSWL